MRAVLIAAGGLVVKLGEFWVALAAVIRRRLRARERARQPLPRRTRTAPGIPFDGPRLSWQDTLAWHAIVGQYGPDAPAWPGSEKTAP